MDGMDRSSSISSSNIRGKKRRLKSGGDVHQVLQLNEYLFELCKPFGKPSLQILFFHGFQFGDYDNAHISTWESQDEDGTFIWPQTWLREEFPDAHILSIGYNCHKKESREYGSMDLFSLGENLMADLLAEIIGQDRRCPVVLVGHSFGGLVMKKLCLIARDKGITGSTEYEEFLVNVKGLFFYSTPHHGIRSDEVLPLFESKGLVLEYVESLITSTARLNDDFEKLRHVYNWSIAGVGESCVTKWGSHLPFMVVREASSRYGDYFLRVPGANHITISKPRKKISTTFTFLTKLIREVSETRKVGGVIHQTYGLPDFPSGLDEQVENVKKKLEMTPSPVKVLGIVGMGGIGKTTIAKQLFNDISAKYKYTCFVDSVKGIPIYHLEDWLLTHFHCDGQRLSKIQWSSLKDKTTLIVMDDVDSEDQLKKLPKLDYFLGGSNLIITSRDHNVSTNVYQNCVLYDVEFLTPDHAKKLLCQHVFDMETIGRDHCLAHWVDEVVRKCQGLPLTLEVMGSHLQHYRTNTLFWEEAIRKLGETQPIDGSENDIGWASLKLSFEDLQQEEQQMFIEAGTCFFEQPLEEALAAWSTPYGCAEMVWENLIRRSLVKVVTKRMFDLYDIWGNFADDYEEIWVHEQLRDLAKNMSQQSQTHWVLKNPYHALLMAHNMMKASGDNDAHDDDDDDHKDDDYQDNEGSLIEPLLSYNQQPITFELELLEVHDYQDNEGSVIESLLSYNQPPITFGLELLEDHDYQDNEEGSAIESLLSYNQPQITFGLELLEDHDYQDNEEGSVIEPLLSYNQQPITFGLELLEDDDYQDNEEGSVIESLLSYNQPPVTFGLELLEDPDYQDNDEGSLIEPLLSYNQQPTTFQLELLEDPDYQDNDEGSLIDPLVSYNQQPTTLPLELLEDDDYNDDHEDDDYQDNEGSLIEPLLSYNQPPVTFGLELLGDYDYQGNEERSVIESLLSYNQPPITFGLELLGDHDYQDNEEGSVIESLLSYNQPPITFGLELLEDHDYQDNEEGSVIESLLSYNQPPITFGLELLEDDDCQDNEEGSVTESLLSHNQSPTTLQLELLEDDDDNDDHEDDDYQDNEERSLVESLLSYNQPPTTLRLELLENLEDVKYLYLDNIMLQDFKGNFPRNISLLKWILSEHLGHPKLPDINWKGMNNLGLLHLEGWSISREFIEALGTLTNLHILKLDSLPGFDRLPKDIGNLSSLKQLSLWNLTLSALPESFGDFEALERLSLCRLGISELPESIGRCHSLERLNINWCHSLRSLPETFGGLCSLEKLSITGCERLGRLPDNFGHLKALETLTLKDCRELQSFPDTFGQLKALETLILENCPTLQSLPHNYPELKHLSIISV